MDGIIKLCLYSSWLFTTEVNSDPCATLPPPCTFSFVVNWEMLQSPIGASPFTGDDYIFDEPGVYIFRQTAWVELSMDTLNTTQSWTATTALDTFLIGEEPDYYESDTFICKGETFLPIQNSVGVVWDSFPQESMTLTALSTNDYCSVVEKFYVFVDECEIESEKFTSKGVSNFEKHDTVETITQHGGIYVPNAFSPNGDGVNDLFEVYIHYPEYKLVSFALYDRWGGKLHYYDLPWDGGNLNPGSYVIKVVVDTPEKSINIISDLTIIK